MRFRVAALVAMAGVAVLANTPATAAEQTHASAKVKVWIPDGWDLVNDEGDWTLQDPNEEVTIIATLLEADNFKAALEDLDKELAKQVKSLVRASKPAATKINGLAATSLTARGKLEDIPVEIEVLLIATPADRVMLLYAMAEAGKHKKYSRTITRIFQSIKKI